MAGLYDALERDKPDQPAVSPVRQHIRDEFAGIKAAVGRGVSWRKITDAMVAAGVRDGDGSEPTPDRARALFHAERYANGERRKRRTTPRKAAAAPVEAVRPAAATEAGSAPPAKLAAPVEAGPVETEAAAVERDGSAGPERRAFADPMVVPLAEAPPEPPPKPAGLFGRWARPGGGRDA